MSGNPFTDHPHEIGETYGEHFRTAAGFGLQMTLGGLACLVHAVIPWLFVTTGSETMRRLHRRLTGRADTLNWERHPII